MSETPAAKAAHLIKNTIDFSPRLGIILGSGLGGLAEHIQSATVFPYETLPGFKQSTVAGHAGKLHLGFLENYPVACLQGRVHLYEGEQQRHAIKNMIHTLKLLGCHQLLITNAAGSLCPEMLPGSLMCITDHINLQWFNPLVGDDERFGSRFLNMQNAYHVELRHQLALAAEKMQIKLFNGVYLAVLGPSFETPAEIRAFRILGADAVGMSTVPEVIVAHQCGLQVAAISTITNLAEGLSAEVINHEQTLKMTAQASQNLIKLILQFIRQLSHAGK